jgi:hypothetical protein
MEVDITRMYKISTFPAGNNHKFGIQVPKSINNAVELNNNNGNQLWEEAIKTDLKQLTDYQTFISLYSGDLFQQVIRKFLIMWFLTSNMT